MREIVVSAIEQLCIAFARHGYNPTPILDLGVLVAYADGQIDVHERSMLRDVFQALLETTLTPELVDHLITASVEVIQAAGAEPRARLVGEILADCEAGDPGIVVALGVAFASEGLSDKERAVIDRIADAAGVAQERVAQLIAHAREAGDVDPVSVRQALTVSSRRG